MLSYYVKFLCKVAIAEKDILCYNITELLHFRKNRLIYSEERNTIRVMKQAKGTVEILFQKREKRNKL